MRTNRRARTALLILLLALGGAARAGVVAYDGFEDYAAGSGLNGASGGSGWDGAGWSSEASATVQNANLSYSSGTVSIDGGDRALQISNSGNTPVNVFSRAFDAAETADALYVRFLFRAAAVTNTDSTDLMLVADASTHLNSGAAHIVYNSPNLQCWNRLLGNTTSQRDDKFDTNLSVDTTHLIVVKLFKSVSGAANNFDRGTVFVDPDDQTTESGTASAMTVQSLATSSIGGVLGRFDNIGSTDVYLYDELRVGTTWYGALDPPPSGGTTIPEPGAFGLLVGAFAGLAARRRRRL